MSDIGKRIKSCRENNRISQYELADKLDVTQKTVSAWETGRAEPSIDMAVRIAKTLGVSSAVMLLDNLEETSPLTEEEAFFIEAVKNANPIQRMKAYHVLVTPDFSKKEG